MVEVEVFRDEDHGDVAVIAPGIARGYPSWDDAVDEALRIAKGYRRAGTLAMGVQVVITLHPEKR